MTTNPAAASGMTLAEAAQGMARLIDAFRAGLPSAPDYYIGNRCGWYPAKPKRHRPALSVSTVKNVRMPR